MFNPESLLHRQRSEICSRGARVPRDIASTDFVRLLSGQVNCVRMVQSVVNFLVSGMAVFAEMQNTGDPGVRAEVVAVIEHVLGSD